MGMVPNRHWRLKHVKEYFGLKGNKESILAQLEEMIEDSHTQEDRRRSYGLTRSPKENRKNSLKSLSSILL
jgi:hypothetical protein